MSCLTSRYSLSKISYSVFITLLKLSSTSHVSSSLAEGTRVFDCLDRSQLPFSLDDVPCGGVDHLLLLGEVRGISRQGGRLEVLEDAPRI